MGAFAGVGVGMSSSKSLSTWEGEGKLALSTGFGVGVGAVSVNALKSWATRAYPDLWLLILGGLFVVVVLLMPKGIAGLPAQVKGVIQGLRARREEPAPETPETPAAK